MPTRRVDADRKDGRCRLEGSMPTRRLVDDDWKGRCRPEGSMPTRRLVDADEKGRCRPEWSMLWRIPTCPEKPERQTVGIPEKSGTQSRRSDSSGKYRNTEQSEYRLVRKHRRIVRKTLKHRRAGTSDPFGNIGSSTQVEDTREPRHPEEGESEPRREAGTGRRRK
jgi:hypothetical protein